MNIHQNKFNREHKYRVNKERLITLLTDSPHLTHTQLKERGYNPSMIKTVRKELGININKTGYLSRSDMEKVQ